MHKNICHKGNLFLKERNKSMKNKLQSILGYIGYFLIGFIALRAIINKEDKIGFIILIIGLTLLINYVHSLEKSLKQ